MVEWLKASVLKTEIGFPIVGSNPTLSEKQKSMHQTEFKIRSFFVLFSFLFSALTIYQYSTEFLFLLTVSSGMKDFIFTDITEAFHTHLKIAYTFGFFGTLPFLLYQGFCFFAPGLFNQERTYYIKNIYAFLISILCGILFAYKIAIPTLSEFFLSFQILESSSFQIQIEARIVRIVQFSFNILIISAFLFSIPWIALILLKKGIFKRKTISENRNALYFLIFLGVAFFCPPDVNIQIMISICLVLIFECILFLGYLGEFYMQKVNAGNQHCKGLIAQLVRVYA